MSEKSINYKAHRDWEGVDEITIKQVPRFKTSGLSGDEWRVSSVITFKRRGEVIYERGFHKMEDAAKFLPWVLDVELLEHSTFKHGIFGHFEEECAQPGCDKPSANHYRLKKEYASPGGEELPQSTVFEHRRAFCERHSVRGDCGLEDADCNYELVKGAGHKTLPPGDISPSAFGGIVEV